MWQLPALAQHFPWLRRQSCAQSQRARAAQVSAQELRGLPDARRAAVLDRLAAVRLYAVGARLRCAGLSVHGHGALLALHVPSLWLHCSLPC